MENDLIELNRTKFINKKSIIYTLISLIEFLHI
jgi:hypothetical protein